MALRKARLVRFFTCAVVLAGAVHSWRRDQVWAADRPQQTAEHPRRDKAMTAIPLSKIDRCLKSGDWGLRRRALWVLAQTHGRPDLVVDRMVVVDRAESVRRTPVFPVLQLLGKAALPPLYKHLQAETAGLNRYYVFATITLVGEPDAAARRALEELSRRTANDEDLGQLALILRAGASEPKQAEALLKKAALDEPRATVRWMGDEGTLWPLMAYNSTRPAALQEARRRLATSLAIMDRGGEPDYGSGIAHPLHGLLIAARTGTLTAADVPLLEKGQAAISRRADYVPLLMAKWRAFDRKDPKLLEAMLKAADPRYPVGHTALALDHFMGDEMLREGDLAALTARATNEKSDEGVRLGAVYLLRLTGAPNRETRDAMLRLAESNSDVVALHAAFAIGCLLEPLDEKAQFVHQVRSLLEKEKRASVREGLQNSLKILEAL